MARLSLFGTALDARGTGLSAMCDQCGFEVYTSPGAEEAGGVGSSYVVRPNSEFKRSIHTGVEVKSLEGPLAGLLEGPPHIEFAYIRSRGPHIRSRPRGKASSSPAPRNQRRGPPFCALPCYEQSFCCLLRGRLKLFHVLLRLVAPLRLLRPQGVQPLHLAA